VLLGGEVLSPAIELVSTRKDPASVFKVHDVHVKVDTLKFAIRGSSHDFLYKTLWSLATDLIKKQTQKAIKDTLITGTIDRQLVSVRDRIETAKNTEGQNRTDMLKELFTKKSDEAGSTKPTESKSQFKIVVDKRNGILVNEENLAGWVNRTAEKEKLATQGEEWRSDIHYHLRCFSSR